MKRRKRKQQFTPSEPSQLNMSDFDIMRSFNWYRQNYNEKDARRFLLEYIQCAKKRAAVNSQSYIPLSVCWGARLIANGNTLPSSVVTHVEKYIESAQPRKKVVTERPMPTVSAEEKSKRIVARAYAYASEMIEKLYDSKGKEEISAVAIVEIYQLNRSQALELAEEIYTAHIQDLEQLSKDEDLQEAYSFLTKRQQSLIHKNLKNFRKELQSVKNEKAENSKKKVRKVRIKPIEEQLAKLKFIPKVFENVEQINMKHLPEKKVLYLVSEEKRSLIRLESAKGFEIRSAFLTNVEKAERYIIYGKELEAATKLLKVPKKDSRVMKTFKGYATVRRVDEIELKNNEYRSTDKFCVVQGFNEL